MWLANELKSESSLYGLIDWIVGGMTAEESSFDNSK